MKRLFLVGALLWALPAYAQDIQQFKPTGYAVAPLAVDTAGESASIPSGTQSVLVMNVAATDAFCQPGSSATTSAVRVPSGGSFVFLMNTNTTIACITSSASTTVNIVPGSGYSYAPQTGSGNNSGSGSVTATITSPLDGGNVAVKVENATTLGQATMANSSPVVIASNQTAFPVTLGNTTANSHIASTALEASHVIKASAGTLYGFYCSGITGGTTGYCIANNTTTAPGSGSASTPLDICYFTTIAGCSFSRIPMGAAYGTGITILISSNATPFTFTSGVLTGFIGADFQ